jgi:LuxR family transcriptional regulator, activator of tox operons
MTPATSQTNLDIGQLAFTMEALGQLAHAAGSSRFLPALYEMLVRVVDNDAVHIDHDRMNGNRRGVVWVGSSGRDHDLVERTMTDYYRDYASDDTTYAAAGDEDELKLIQLSAQKVDAELRRIFFDIADIHDECVISCTVRGMRYSMSVVRSKRLPPFSLKELSILKHLASVVLPLAAAHERIAGAISLDAGERAAVDDPLAQWLPHLHAKLTEREAHVCASFIQGMATQAIAQAMGVKPSTVETYAKRAFVKLGVDSRRQLLSLVLRHAPSHAADTAAA